MKYYDSVTDCPPIFLVVDSTQRARRILYTIDAEELDAEVDKWIERNYLVSISITQGVLSLSPTPQYYNKCRRRHPHHN